MNTRDAQDPVDGFERFMKEVADGTLSRQQLLKRAAAAGVLLGGAGSILGKSAATASAARVAGGTMKVAIGFSATNSFDPHVSQASPGRFRQWNVYSLLYEYNAKGQLVPALAKEAVPNKNASVWTLRLKSGITWHDGSPLTADDVIYSLKRILDKATKAEGAGQISMIDAAGLRKIDPLTIRIPLKYPFSIFPAQLIYYISIVKNGTTSFNPPIGTGPFKFVSEDSQKLVLAKNPNYFVSNAPLLDGVEFINIQDPTARLNALKTGQVDAIYPSDATQAAAARSDKSLQVFVNRGGSFLPIYMNVKQKPFSDNRVRQALKFAANRTKMNDLAYGGKGFAGNDMFGLFDPGYPKSLPQRQYDPERAKALWKQAGMSGKSVELWTADVFPGQATSCLAYAQEAKAAGIGVKVRKLPSDQFFAKIYGTKPFANDYWQLFPILTIMSSGFIPGAPYAYVSGWTSPETTKLYKAAAAQTNSKRRNELTAELARRFRDTGPYVVWAYEASLDIYSTKVGGIQNNAVMGLNGRRFDGYFLKA